MTKPIYLDYAAATPLDPRVEAAMRPFFSDQFYNPSSSYLAAKAVKTALEAARGRVAHWLGAKPSEIVFTAGATESINLAIQGIMQANPGGSILVCGTEHEAVLAAARPFKHQIIPVAQDGAVELDSISKLIDDTTVLISVGLVNNEIGTIQPLKDIASQVQQIRRIRQLKNNPRPLYLHTDASQAGCYLDLHASRLGVDLMTLNGAKMYGPKQSGVLFVKAGIQPQPLIFGGGQENGWRSGTENVSACVGLATALDIAQAERKAAIVKISSLRYELLRLIQQTIPNTVVNGNIKKHAPHILHLSWPGVDGERLLMQLDEAGIMASTGSACAANKQTASHVLRACGMSADTIQGSLRLSLGRGTNSKQVVAAAHIIAKLTNLH